MALGLALASSATEPDTTGQLMDVPDRTAYALSLPLPGAQRGSRRRRRRAGERQRGGACTLACKQGRPPGRGGRGGALVDRMLSPGAARCTVLLPKLLQHARWSDGRLPATAMMLGRSYLWVGRGAGRQAGGMPASGGVLGRHMRLQAA